MSGMLSAEDWETLAEWKDVEPVRQDDGENPVVPINYPPEFVSVMDVYRAMVRMGDTSERALKLTGLAIKVNSANYSAWNYRRKVLKALGSDLEEELKRTSSIMIETPKNYQVWYHRRALVDQLGNASLEKEFTKLIFEDDSKNYHAWAHRQWMLTRFQNWDGELDFVDELLKNDIRNNSAWNHRWFVVHRGKRSGISKEDLNRELEYACQSIPVAPNNESPWVYLRGLIRGKDGDDYECVKALKPLLVSMGAWSTCPYAVGFEVDRLLVRATDERVSEALKLVDLLANKLDPIRKRYWDYRRVVIEKAPVSGRLEAGAPAGSSESSEAEGGGGGGGGGGTKAT